MSRRNNAKPQGTEYKFDKYEEGYKKGFANGYNVGYKQATEDAKERYQKKKSPLKIAIEVILTIASYCYVKGIWVVVLEKILDLFL